jgi:branched-chain amino acid transport system ATP-binding protein
LAADIGPVAVPALELQGLTAGYGRITGIENVDLTVAEGETVALLGANGAGKSTFLRAVSGMIKPWAGRVTLYGDDVTGQRSDRLVRRGLAHVPEGRRILATLTVEENLRLGAFSRRRAGTLDEDLDAVLTRFERLGERRAQKAGTLSGGEQQMLAIGRALMSRPRILLLDEPSLGLSPRLIGEVFELIRSLAADGLTILLVEQNARQALGVADRGYLLTTGSVTLSGAADDLLADPGIIESYLGGRGARS